MGDAGPEHDGDAGPEHDGDAGPGNAAERADPPAREPADGGKIAAPPLSRNVKVVSAVSFCQDAASEMLHPILPLFITSVLGAPPAVVGLIEGLAEATSSGMKVISGRLADVRRRRPLVAAGYAAAAAGKLIIALAVSWPMVLAARVVDRFGKGLRTSPRDLLIVADTPPEVRGRAFGFHRAADTAGAVVGPVFALAVYLAAGRSFRPVFYAALVPAVLSVLLVGLIREPGGRVAGDADAATSPEPPEAAAETPGADPRTGPAPEGSHLARRTEAATGVVRHDGLPRTFKRVLGLVVLFSLVNFPDALLLVRARQLGLGFTAVIGVYILYNLVYAGLSYPAGRLADKISKRAIFAAGMGIFGLCYFGLGLTRSAVWVWILLPLYGAYTALTDGVGKAWVANLLPPARAGTGLGLFHGLTGGAVLVAGLWAGLAWGPDGRLPLMAAGLVGGGLALCLAASGRLLDA